MHTEIIANGLLGGSLIGLSAIFLMLTLGRISGISGITSSLLSFRLSKQNLLRATFLVGLLIGPVVYLALFGKVPDVVMEKSFSYLVAGGALVGFGASMGSGCTSGNGVCGLARFSPRSIVSTVVFLTTSIITVFLSR